MLVRSMLGLSLWLLVFSTSCEQVPPPDTQAADVRAIHAAEAAWDEAFANKDTDKATAFYAADASLLIPNRPILIGVDAIKGRLKTVLDDANFKLTFKATHVDVAKSGDLGYSQGPYAMTTTDPVTKKPVDDKGKYLTVWKKQTDGNWKAVEDTFMTDSPLLVQRSSQKPRRARSTAARHLKR